VDAAAFNIFLLQPNRTGGLATWDFYNEYLSTVERVFASQYNFVWDVDTHTLRIIRRPTADEDVIVRVFSRRSEDDILTDPYMRPWVRSYSTALCKMYLGEARAKFPGGFPGPTGNVTYNGAEIKQEAIAEMAKLEKEIYDIVTGPDGYRFYNWLDKLIYVYRKKMARSGVIH